MPWFVVSCFRKRSRPYRAQSLDVEGACTYAALQLVSTVLSTGQKASMELSDHGYEVLLQYLSPADTAALRCVSRSWQVCEGLKRLQSTLFHNHKLC